MKRLPLPSTYGSLSLPETADGVYSRPLLWRVLRTGPQVREVSEGDLVVLELWAGSPLSDDEAIILEEHILCVLEPDP